MNILEAYPRIRSAVEDYVSCIPGRIRNLISFKFLKPSEE